LILFLNSAPILGFDPLPAFRGKTRQFKRRQEIAISQSLNRRKSTK